MHSNSPISIAVVGAGAFGRNHLRVWRQLETEGFPLRLAALVDPDTLHSGPLAAEYQIPAYPSVQLLLAAHSQIHAASVAVPTAEHAAVATPLLAAGVDVLVEKPFTSTLQQADSLILLARQKHCILQVGHLERFNPAIQAVRPLLNHPRFFEAHRLSVFTQRSLDVDVVLDLMIHDLDIVLSFVASPVREVRAVGLPVLSPKVDIANVRVEFESGCIANFTASRVSTEQVRKLRFFQPHQYISIDYARQDVLMIDVPGRTIGTGSSTLPDTSVRFQPADTEHPTAQFGMRKLVVPSGEPLRLELESFAHCVRHRTQPIVSAENGRAALSLALEILAAIHEHHERANLPSILSPAK